MANNETPSGPKVPPSSAGQATVASAPVFNVNPPPPFVVGGVNLFNDWEAFKRENGIFSVVTQVRTQTEELQKATFLSCLGIDARKWLKGQGIDVMRLTKAQIVAKIDEKCQRSRQRR